MEQLRKLFANLSVAQRILILAASLAVGASLFAFTRWRRESDFRPLYTTLASEDAGAVVQKLKEGGVEYRLSENGSTVLVPSAKLAEMRLEMAAAGLPKSGRIGFELFDKTNFGATEFVEHINYRRALEGELERTVMSLAEVEQARVHVTFPKESVYLESRQPAKASVVVKIRPGTQLSPQNVIAIEHLLASAVEGLAPEAVSVLDVRGNLLSRTHAAGAADGGASSDRLLEARQSIERDLIAKISSTLEPLLGPEKFRAGASVECDFTSGEQSEEIFRPGSLGHGQLAKIRGLEQHGRRGRHTRHGRQSSPSAAASPGRPGRDLAPHRKHRLPIQPNRPPREDARRHGEADVTFGAGRPGRALGRAGRQDASRSRAAHAREAEIHTRSGRRRHGTFCRPRRPAHRRESAVRIDLNGEPPMVGAAPQPSGKNNVNLPPWLARVLENRMMLGGGALGFALIVMFLRRTVTKMFGRKGKTEASASGGAAVRGGPRRAPNSRRRHNRSCRTKRRCWPS